ncbi:YveK family protein [Paenibacillus methanolicus]|uniref:Capsular polysaccharide biosynthesis protein n=1 Tax=Paenibacillus methanolicus TaxID=582686 RepID=A0A5S5BSX8_9BACL|nr:Wzz/FepE/Etk N-terminal domain-containing protein [Paenibacillus methanolicus]TYP70281.1 capsular polysaccharide biosynthesis protein [Paenibacillus methanolicus]
MELKQYVAAVKKKIWFILAITIIFAILAGVYSSTMVKPVYQASAKLVVNKTNSEDPNTPPSFDSINTNLLLINTYKEIITSYAILDIVTEKYPQITQSSSELSRSIAVSSAIQSQVMTVVARGSSYEEAASIVNAVAETFKTQVTKIMNVDNVEILNTAKLDQPTSPVTPSPIASILVAIILGLLLSTGGVIALYHLDDTVKSESDILNLTSSPVLAVIHTVRKQDIAQRGNSVRQTIPTGEQTYVSSNN